MALGNLSGVRETQLEERGLLTGSSWSEFTGLVSMVWELRRCQP